MITDHLSPDSSTNGLPETGGMPLHAASIPTVSVPVPKRARNSLSTDLGALYRQLSLTQQTASVFESTLVQVGLLEPGLSHSLNAWKQFLMSVIQKLDPPPLPK